jgi:hypothetical protein
MKPDENYKEVNQMKSNNSLIKLRKIATDVANKLKFIP